MEPPKEDHTNGSKQNSAFKQRVERFFKQLTEGCGRKNCDNCLCVSNPALKSYKIQPNVAGVLSIELAKNNKSESLLCSTDALPSGEILYMDLKILCNLVETSAISDNFTSMMDILDKIISSYEFLGYCFMKNPVDVLPDGTDAGIDIGSVNQFYEIISTLPDPVQTTVAKAFERLAKSLRYDHDKEANSKALLRKLIFLIESPKIIDDAYKELTISTFSFATSLPPQIQKFLKENYVARWSEEKFRFYHQTLQDFIALRILTSPNRNVIHDDRGVISATKFIGWLWEVNKSRNLLKTSEFYNQVINDSIKLKIEYNNWSRNRGFAFSEYPYILNPETKSQIINLDALVSQTRRNQETLRLWYQGVLTAPYCLLKVRRDHLIEDSVDTLTVIKMENPNDLKKQLKVVFVGEQGIDEGGVRKEWFQLIVDDLFDVKYGMFIHDKQTRTYWFNHAAQDFNEFELLGTVVGLAIYNAVILDLHFPLIVYKKLCGLKLNFDDLEEIYPDLHHGLKQLLQLEGDVESLDLTFEVSFEVYGTPSTYPLKPNGDKIPVTKENREEYVALYTEYLLEQSISLQFNAFKKGFDSVCAGPALKLFEPEELQQLICGSAVLDFDELEKSTTYDNGYDPEHPTIKNFWEVVRNFTLEEKKKLLFFTTGSDRCPIGGLKNLNLVIARNGGDTNRLPTSHTCFNHLLLPQYENKKKLEELLKKAITNSTGFGML